MAEVLAVITARGGSKGVPRKNIRSVGDKPLIAWSIESARSSDRIDDILISTDDKEIADVCRDWGCEVPFLRPAEFAKDDSPHYLALQHAVEWYESMKGCEISYLVLLQPTSPFRSSGDIDGCVRLATERDATGVFSVEETHVHPILTRRLADEGTLENYVTSDLSYLRRQDLPPALFVNGAVWVVKPKEMMKQKTVFVDPALGYIMPSERSWQIDTEWELAMADMMARNGLVGKSETVS